MTGKLFPHKWIIWYTTKVTKRLWNLIVIWLNTLFYLYTVFQKKTSTHIIGYKLRNSCPILIIFDTKIPHIIWHRKMA